jgi:hypothetical protein
MAQSVWPGADPLSRLVRAAVLALARGESIGWQSAPVSVDGTSDVAAELMGPTSIQHAIAALDTTAWDELSRGKHLLGRARTVLFGSRRVLRLCDNGSQKDLPDQPNTPESDHGQLQARRWCLALDMDRLQLLSTAGHSSDRDCGVLGSATEPNQPAASLAEANTPDRTLDLIDELVSEPEDADGRDHENDDDAVGDGHETGVSGAEVDVESEAKNNSHPAGDSAAATAASAAPASGVAAAVSRAGEGAAQVPVPVPVPVPAGPLLPPWMACPTAAPSPLLLAALVGVVYQHAPTIAAASAKPTTSGGAKVIVDLSFVPPGALRELRYHAALWLVAVRPPCAVTEASSAASQLVRDMGEYAGHASEMGCFLVKAAPTSWNALPPKGRLQAGLGGRPRCFWGGASPVVWFLDQDACVLAVSQ